MSELTAVEHADGTQAIEDAGIERLSGGDQRDAQPRPGRRRIRRPQRAVTKERAPSDEHRTLQALEAVEEHPEHGDRFSESDQQRAVAEGQKHSSCAHDERIADALQAQKQRR
jgi:hypothetical protein